MKSLRIIQIEANVKYREPDYDEMEVSFVVQVKNCTGAKVMTWGVFVEVTDGARAWIPAVGKVKYPNEANTQGKGSLLNGQRDEVTVSFYIPVSFGEGVRRLQYGNAPCKLEFRIEADSDDCDSYQSPETGVHDLSGTIYSATQLLS